MKRVILLFLLISVVAYANMTLTLSLNGKGYAYRGDGTDNTNTVFNILAQETAAATNTLTDITLTASDIFFNSDVSGKGITAVDILDGSTSIVTGTNILGADSPTALITVSDAFTASQSKTYTVKLTLGTGVTLNNTRKIELTAGNCQTGSVTPAGGAQTFKITGVDYTFDAPTTGSFVFDADRQNFKMLSFQITPNATDSFLFSKITVSNPGTAQFDAGDTQTNQGVTNLYLYEDDGDNEFDSGDTLIKSVATFNNSNVTLNSAIIEFSASDGDAIRKVSGLTRFLLLYEIGVSTNIVDENDTALTVQAKITEIEGSGSDSGLTYSPISISNDGLNNANVSLAGMIIKSVENIFPSMNVAAGLTDIPILKFVAKSIGVDTRLKTLVISNDSETFDTNSNNTGVTNLTWVKDSSGETYSGYCIYSPCNSVLDTKLSDASLNIDSSTKATFSYDNALVDISAGAEQAFFVLADFGTNMSAGQSISLNVHEDTKASHLTKGDLSIGSDLPMTVTPTQSITLVTPIITVKTPIDQKIGNNFVGLACDTDNDSDATTCTNVTTKKLVAGMYDLRMYVFDVDVASQVSGAMFEFQSPNKFFSEQSVGVSKLSLYLDKDKDGILDTGDVFLGSTETFLNSGQTAQISNVSMPQGQDQKLLLIFDLGQRIAMSESDGVSDDQLSIQLSNITVTDNLAAALLPNPISPYTFDVAKHQLELNSLKTGISDENVITQASVFDVTAVIKANFANTKLVQIGTTGVPSSVPKFYLDGVSGKNRSYEFTQTFDSTKSNTNLFDTIVINNEKKIVYTVSAANITSEGNYLIDFDVYYQMDTTDWLPNATIRLTRSKGAGTDYKSAADLSDESATNFDKITPSMTTTNEVYSWSLPSYISSVNVQVNNKFVGFYNYQSVPSKAQLKVTFINNGENIDSESLELQLNGTAVKKESEIASGSDETYYEYDTLTGELVLSSLGSTSGTLTISAKDDFGQLYPSAPLIFYTSETLEIEKFLVHPNPFSPSITTAGVTFGFSLTQAATVGIKVYDATGREISQLPDQSFQMGYNTVAWNSIITSSSKYMPSGTYYLKLTATASDGTKKVATTKMAVY